MGSVNAERYSREADRANSDYDLAQRDAEQQLVLAGLRQMADAQQNAQSVYNTRLQNLTGFAKGLLGGLFD